MFIWSYRHWSLHELLWCNQSLIGNSWTPNRHFRIQIYSWPESVSFRFINLRGNHNSLLPANCISPSMSAGEICAFNIHGLDAPFEAVVLNGTSGEGQLRARGLVDCELQKEYTFIIQAHDCGSGPRGTEGKKSHKWVEQTLTFGSRFFFHFAFRWTKETVQTPTDIFGRQNMSHGSEAVKGIIL